MGFARRFAAFWYDFLVGDRWELFLGPVAALLLVGLALAVGVAPGVAGILLVVVILAVGALSVGWATRG